MPVLQDDPGAVSQTTMAALELFCNLEEQSYEQFLSTFTHLSTENVTAGSLKDPKEENKTCLAELDRRDSMKTDRKVDTAEETEDLHSMKEVCMLPGEVEEDLPAYAPAFCRCTQLELSSTDMEHKTHTPPKNTENQSETGEVVHFRLDDTFDYDNAVLSHKYPVKSSDCGSS